MSSVQNLLESGYGQAQVNHLARDALFEFGTGVSLDSLSTHKETYPCTALKDQAHLHRLITTV